MSIQPAPPITRAETDVKYLEDKSQIQQLEIAGENEYLGDSVALSPFEDMPFWKTMRTFKWAAMFSTLAAASAAADGYQIVMTGSIVANQGFVNQFGTELDAKGNKILAADHLALWGGMGSLGQGLGMVTTHFIADRFGRKFGFYWLWLSLLVGVSCESFGRSWQVWTVAKIFSMYGVGSVQFLTGTYISEIVPARCRGFLLICYSVWFGIGNLLCSVGLKTLNDHEPLVYLKAVYTEWAMLGMMAIIYVCLPESPYWLADKGKHEAGVRSLRRINGKIEGYDVDFHYGLVRRTVELEKQRSEALNGERRGLMAELISLKEVFSGINGFRTLIAFTPAAIQQLMGQQVISGYGAYFTQVSGFADPFLFGVLQSLCGLLITILLVLVIDHIGRRTAFMTSMAISWFSLVIIGGLGLVKNPSHSLNQGVVFFVLCWVMFGGNLGTLGWAFVAEVPSSRLRAKTAGIAAAGGVVISIVFSTSVPYMLNPNYANWGLKTCFFFAGLSIPFCIVTYFIIPDLSKRTPAEVDEMFEKKVRPWRFRKYVTDAQKALAAVKATGETDVLAMQEQVAGEAVRLGLPSLRSIILWFWVTGC